MKQYVFMYMSLGIFLGITGCERRRAEGGRAEIVAVDGAEAAAEVLRGRRIGLDAEGCAEDGEALVLRYPESGRLRAWWIGCVSATGRNLEANALAEAMLAERPDDPWAEFARVNAWLGEQPMIRPEALAGSRALLTALDGHPDALWLHARVLKTRVHLVPEALAFAAMHPDAEPSARVAALFAAAREDATRLPEALAIAHGVAANEPEFVAVAQVAASWLPVFERTAEALAWADAGLARAPDAGELLGARWKLLPKEDALEDMSGALGRAGVRPAVLLAAAEAYRAHGEAGLAEPLEARIVDVFADSPAAETVLFQRLEVDARRTSEPSTEDPEAAAIRREMLAAFLARPRHHNPHKLERAAGMLFEAVIADPAATPEAILAAVEGWCARVHGPPIPFMEGARVLIERTQHFDRAEALARAGIAAIEVFARALSDSGSVSGDAIRRDYLMLVHTALGDMYLKTGRIAEAEAALTQAERVSRGPYAALQLGLAEVARRRGDLEAAEVHLIGGVDLIGESGDRCRRALEALYRERTGSLRGLEAYSARLAERSRERRRDAVLASFAEDGAEVPSFALRDLDGRTVTSESLRGKVAVVHFWFNTCPGCLLEVPEFEAFAAAHAADPEVAVVSVHSGGVASEVAAWMTQRGLRFEVLMDDGYCGRARIGGFPTTWFLDQEGRLRFTAADASMARHLREEFEWRVEALRGAKGARTRAPGGAAAG